MKKILLPVLFASCLNTNSQTYTAGTIYSSYYDINPDTLINYVVYPYTHETYGLNLFDDPTIDFQITANGAVSSGGTGAAVTLISMNPNVYFRSGRLDSVYVPAYSYWDITKVALPLNAGDPINSPGATWDTTLLYLTDHSGWGGGVKNVNDWIGLDKYIGLKYDNGNLITYGWIRVQCLTKDSCLVKDYSYAPSSFAIQKTEQTTLNIFPNPIKGAFMLQNINPETLDFSQLTMTDMYGRLIMFTSEIKDRAVKITPDSKVLAGCYLLHCFVQGRPYTIKIMKAE